jgi:single-strand DNA-binding protein
MPNINRVIIAGHLGRDAELKAAGKGQVTNLSVATSERWKDANGTQQEKTDWHNVEVWGKSAEFAAQCKKGAAVLVEGKITGHDWVDKQGNKRHTVSIRADRFYALDKKSGGVSVPEDSIPF